MKKKMKKYTVYYHRKGEGKRKFNVMWTTIDATSSRLAMYKIKKRLGKNWIIEKATRKQ